MQDNAQLKVVEGQLQEATALQLERARATQLEGELDAARQQALAQNQTVIAARSALPGLQSDVAALGSQIESLNQQHERDRLAVTALTNERDHQSQQIDDLRDRLRQAIAAGEEHQVEARNAKAKTSNLQREYEELKQQRQQLTTSAQEPAQQPGGVSDRAINALALSKKASGGISRITAENRALKQEGEALRSVNQALTKEIDALKKQIRSPSDDHEADLAEQRSQEEDLRLVVQQVTALQNENTRLHQELDTLSRQGQVTSPEITELRNQLTKSDRRIADLDSNLAKARDDGRRLNDDNQQLLRTQRTSELAAKSATGRVSILEAENKILGDQVASLQHARNIAKDDAKRAKQVGEPSNHEVARLRQRADAAELEARQTKALLAPQQEALLRAQEQVRNAQVTVQDLAHEIEVNQAELNTLRHQQQIIEDVSTLPQAQALLGDIGSSSQAPVGLTGLLGAAQTKINQLKQTIVDQAKTVDDASHLLQRKSQLLEDAQQQAQQTEPELMTLRAQIDDFQQREEALEQQQAPSTATSSSSSGSVSPPQSRIVRSPTPPPQNVPPSVTTEEFSRVQQQVEALERLRDANQTEIAHLASENSSIKARMKDVLKEYQDLTDEVLKRESAAAQSRGLDKGPGEAAREMLLSQELRDLQALNQELAERLAALTRPVTAERGIQTESYADSASGLPFADYSGDLSSEFPATQSKKAKGSTVRPVIPVLQLHSSSSSSPLGTSRSTITGQSTGTPETPVKTNRRVPPPPSGALPKVPAEMTPRQIVFSRIRGDVAEGSLTARSPTNTNKPDILGHTPTETPRQRSARESTMHPFPEPIAHLPARESPIAQTPQEYIIKPTDIQMADLIDDPNLDQAIRATFETLDTSQAAPRTYPSVMDPVDRASQWVSHLDNASPEDLGAAQKVFYETLLPASGPRPTSLLNAEDCPDPLTNERDFANWREQVGHVAWDAFTREAHRIVDEQVAAEAPVSPQGATKPPEPESATFAFPMRGEFVEEGDERLPMLPSPQIQQEAVEAIFRAVAESPQPGLIDQPAITPIEVIDRLRRTEAFIEALYNAITDARAGSGASSLPAGKLLNVDLKSVLQGRLNTLKANRREIPSDLLARIINFLRWSALPRPAAHGNWEGKQADYDFSSAGTDRTPKLKEVKAALAKIGTPNALLDKANKEARQEYLWEALRSWDEDFIRNKGGRRYAVRPPAEFRVQAPPPPGPTPRGTPHYLRETTSTKAKWTPKAPPSDLSLRASRRSAPSAAESPPQGRRLFSTPEKTPDSTSTRHPSAKKRTSGTRPQSPVVTNASTESSRKSATTPSAPAAARTSGKNHKSKGKTTAGQTHSPSDDSPRGKKKR
ncbi:MAG: hypothetical protein ACOYKZ_05055 [Chlamydiia bacterium]